MLGRYHRHCKFKECVLNASIRELYLSTIIKNKHLTMLKGGHCTSICVQVWIYKNKSAK